MNLFKKSILISSALALALLPGCKSADENDDDTSSPASTTTTLTGSVTAGAVGGAELYVEDTNGNQLAGPIDVTDGTFTISNFSKAHLSKTLVFISKGGSYTDETTSSTVNLDSSTDELSLIAAADTFSSSSNSVNLTPSSTIIKHAALNDASFDGDPEAAVTRAQTRFQAAFGFTPDYSVTPTVATNPDASADSEDKRVAGLQAAFFSQLTNDQSNDASYQTRLLKALGEDMSDGTWDGNIKSTEITTTGFKMPSDVEGDFENAKLNFMHSDKNKTGLSGSFDLGPIPFVTTFNTANYKVVYKSVVMGEKAGKTKFNLIVTDQSDATVDISSVNLMGMMYMETKAHSTPDEDCDASSDGKTFNCSIYYMMPTNMNGMFSGNWELKVMVTNSSNEVEAAYFYPTVGMAMGHTFKATLKGSIENDSTMGMTGSPEGRTYPIFYDGLTTDATGDHIFSVFIAVKETMMSFPMLDFGTTYDGDMMGTSSYQLTVDDGIVVQISDSTGDSATWVTMDSLGDGHWSNTSTSIDLADSTTDTIFLKLTVNGKTKTTKAGAEYATFDVTTPDVTTP